MSVGPRRRRKAGRGPRADPPRVAKHRQSARKAAPVHCAHDRADQVRTAWIERYEQVRVDGTILVPQMYLLALGRRMGVRPW
jgi:hypothetical protein